MLHLRVKGLKGEGTLLGLISCGVKKINGESMKVHLLDNVFVHLNRLMCGSVMTTHWPFQLIWCHSVCNQHLIPIMHHISDHKCDVISPTQLLRPLKFWRGFWFLEARCRPRRRDRSESILLTGMCVRDSSDLSYSAIDSDTGLLHHSFGSAPMV